MRLSLCCVLAVACTGKSGGDTALQPLVTGRISPDGAGEFGDVAFYHAFAMDAGGRFAAYLSSTPGVTCDDVVGYLTQTDEPEDPTGFFSGGSCDLFVKFSSGWEGAKSATNDPIAGAGLTFSCAMGEGSFVLEERDENDIDYYWSGRWWQGYPQEYRYDFAAEGDSYVLDMEFSSYDGGFIYESPQSVPATGAVSGTITAERCEGIATTVAFQ
jgi:hypothetical protein